MSQAPSVLKVYETVAADNQPWLGCLSSTGLGACKTCASRWRPQLVKERLTLLATAHLFKGFGFEVGFNIC